MHEHSITSVDCVDEAGAAHCPGGYHLEAMGHGVSQLEQVARLAKASDFSGCLPEANYRGNAMAWALSGSFTVFDRLKHPVAGAGWEIYRIPVHLGIPLLTSTAPPIP